MKNKVSLLIISLLVIFSACKKEKESERFSLLTAHAWMSDTLIAKSADPNAAMVAQQNLENFRGEARFNKDLSGYFGIYTGSWRFAFEETSLVIESESLPLALTTNIVELTASSLKVTMLYPNMADATKPIDIRMTFKAR